MSSYSNAVKCWDLTSGSGSHQATVISVLGKYLDDHQHIFPASGTLMNTCMTPQGCLQALTSTICTAVHYCCSSSRSGIEASREPNGSRSWHSCEDGGMKRAEQHVWEKGSATDSAATLTQSPQKLCCQVQGSFSPCLSNGEYDTCPRDAPSTVSDCHTPRADVSGCAAWQISPRTGKQILSLPPAKWLCFARFKEKKEFLFFCWIRYLVFSSDLFVPRKQKGPGISLLRFSTAQNTKDASSKAPSKSGSNAFAYYWVFSREAASIVATRRSIS